jgi:uncharacterized protein YjiS (DUF1127 family)
MTSTTLRLPGALPAGRRRAIPGGLVGRVAGVPLRLASCLERAWRARRDTARLMAMSDAMLKDIGLVRGDIPFAVRAEHDRRAPF